MEIELPSSAVESLTREAEFLGQEIQALVRDILVKEATRLYYIQRTRQTRQPKPTVNWEARKLAKQLREVYARAEVLGVWKPDFEVQLREIDEAEKQGDVAKLLELKGLQKWQQRN